jgi:hypothetical protein
MERKEWEVLFELQKHVFFVRFFINLLLQD